MQSRPTFASRQEYEASRPDSTFWRPHVEEILRRHDLPSSGHELIAGHNSSYPTFLYGEVVVKLFGYGQTWQARHAAERAAYACLARDPEISAPSIVGEGRLFDADTDAWPYLITTRMPGVAAERAGLSWEQERALAVAAGRQVRRVHALPPAGVPTHADWATVSIAEAAARSSLPPHLAAQAEAYVAQLGPFERVVTHGDIVANHVHVVDGRYQGIIDWGDMTVTDRHLELIQVYRDLFHCDRALFRVFLEAAEWPVDADFPLKALGGALHRQAIGLAQHSGIDVFMPIAERYPLNEIATLDDLATVLFEL
jgi:aminoglycoside phosphotransferase